MHKNFYFQAPTFTPCIILINLPSAFEFLNEAINKPGWSPLQSPTNEQNGDGSAR